MSLPSENSWEEQGATAEGKGREGQEGCAAEKMLKKKMEEWLVKTPEKTERWGIEEELNCSIGGVPLHGWWKGIDPGTVFGFDFVRNKLF